MCKFFLPVFFWYLYCTVLPSLFLVILIYHSIPAPVSVGKRGEQGRMDYRLSASTHPAVCIDTKYASFLDDAFSLSPETGELLIHVVDVVS